MIVLGKQGESSDTDVFSKLANAFSNGKFGKETKDKYDHTDVASLCHCRQIPVGEFASTEYVYMENEGKWNLYFRNQIHSSMIGMCIPAPKTDEIRRRFEIEGIKVHETRIIPLDSESLRKIKENGCTDYSSAILAGNTPAICKKDDNGNRKAIIQGLNSVIFEEFATRVPDSLLLLWLKVEANRNVFDIYRLASQAMSEEKGIIDEFKGDADLLYRYNELRRKVGLGDYRHSDVDYPER